MPMPRSREARRYYRVALQRLDDGQLLFSKLQRFPAAVYLAGHAVECILKALVLSGTPDTRHSEVIRQLFRGPRAHNILTLYEYVRASGAAAFPKSISEDLTDISTWSVDLRYNPGDGDAQEARAFLEAVERIVNFCEQRLR